MNITEHNLHSLRKRISAFIVMISFIFFALLVRLAFVEVFNSNFLLIKATDQWTRSLPMTAERGKIYDTSGATLSVSFTTYSVYVRGREVLDAVSLASFLSKKLNMGYDVVYNKVCIKNVSEVLVKMQVEETVAKEIYLKNFKGVFLSESIKRYYPYGDLLTQILGYTTIDNVGQSGVEAYFNNVLQGKDGQFIVQSDLQGKEIENSLRTYVEGVAGNNICLTINASIQLIVEKVLNLVMEEQKAKSASMIIMDAKTGEIIASSSKPSFDLNNVPRDDVAALMELSKNKIVVDVYEPGSTFKILTMAAALEQGHAHLDEKFYCPGYRMIAGEKIKCWKTTGHGSITLTEGIVCSCNCVFMDLASRLGVDSFYNYLKKFGLGSKTGVEVSGESSGILMKQESVKSVDLVRIGFGQAIAVTPLQLITAVCASVNGGYLMTPSIIKNISSSDGKNLSAFSAKTKQKVLGSQTSKTLNNMLAQVVNKTQQYSFVPGYDVGGKTGTAQKYENGAIARGKYISSFIGTFPAQDPKYVMLLLVDEPGAGAYYGSVVAAPYGKMVFSEMFSTLNIKPITSNTEQTFTIMPDVTNLSLTNAVLKLVELGINYEIDGEGGRVIKQLPPAGTKINLNDYVVLITE